MKFEELKKLKASIDTFEDASFVSLLNEDTAIIQHPNGSVWSLPFTFNEGKPTFHPANGKLLQAIEFDESAQDTVDEINKSILEALTNEDDEAYKESLAHLVESFVPRSKNTTSVTEEVKTNEVTPGTLYESLEDEEKEWVTSFENKWAEKVNKIRDFYVEFFNEGYLFDKDGLKKSETVQDPIGLLEAIEAKHLQRENFFESVDKIVEWKEKIAELNIDEAVISKINPSDKNWKTSLTKNLIMHKKDVNSDINISESVLAVSRLHSEIFESDATVNLSLGSDRTPGSYNGETKLNFLKVSGVFTTTDLEKLIEDFSHVLGSWSNKDQDEFKAISGMKDRVDYMYRTNMIDDEEVGSIISSFNGKYGKDGRDLYRNPEMTSGKMVGSVMAPEEQGAEV